MNKKKIILLILIAFTITYFFINYFIGKDKFSSLKSFLGKEQTQLIKKYIFPYKFISQQQEQISQQQNKISKQVIIVKSDGMETFQLSKQNILYVYSANKKYYEILILGVLKNKNIVCYKVKTKKSHKIILNNFNSNCKKAIYYIGKANGINFYFGLKEENSKKSKNLLVLPATNFYNYSSNQFSMNQYSSSENYISNLSEVPTNSNMFWATNTSQSIHNISKVIENFETTPDYKFQNLELENYNLIILPLHQEYVSKAFLDNLLNFLKLENKIVLSIGGANFMREVDFKQNKILYLKDKLINTIEYNLNTITPGERRENKNCIFLDDESFILGEITEPKVSKDIEYFFPNIKCVNNKKEIPLLSIQSFDEKKTSKLLHILSDGIGINFTKFEYLKSKILDEIKKTY